MNWTDLQLSFEFFPPKTGEGQAKLLRTAHRLNEWTPSFFSVTYGAGGSTKERTFETISMLRDQGLDAIPHLSWGENTESDMKTLLNRYVALGIDRLVVLRGDIQPRLGPSVYVRHARELVQFVKREYGDQFKIHVAAYPEVHPDAASATEDIQHLKEKIDAGADGCITQYFYNIAAYQYFTVRCRTSDINVPIVPGIMPITNYEWLVNFSSKCGAEIPRWIQQRLADLANDESEIITFGIDVVTDLCERLLDQGAPGIHFYTLNRSKLVVEIVSRLGVGK